VSSLATGEQPKMGYMQKVAWDMSDLYLNTSSIMHCDECHERLGMFHILRYALFKKQGTHYFVPCKACGHRNERVKGQYKTDTEQRWKDFQRGEQP